MSLVRFDQVSLAFGDQPLLREADFEIDTGERVCLVGRNGAGKTSLLRLITGVVYPDSGTIEQRSGIGISVLEQILPEALEETVDAFVAGGLARLNALVAEFQERSRQHLEGAALHELEALQHEIDVQDGWRIQQRVDSLIEELELPRERRLGELSGGWRRRVALARALVSKPDLLLLDEPTNHLDLATIGWLENVVYRYPGAVLFITHDRAFLDRLATRIVELDRGRLLDWPGSYREFLRRKEDALAEERAHNVAFDKKLAEEEAWIRQGIKARRHRNQNRVRALMAMREERAARLAPQSRAHIAIDEGEDSGRKVIEVKNVSHGFGAQTLIRHFSCKIMRGDRVGLIGNNGVGKSTLLRILLGEITPREGVVKLGTNLQTGYFDQLREQLDPDKTVAEIVGDGKDHITINGRPRHVVGYLKGFLFSPKRALQPVRALSGGERNRVILARLFTRPTNLLVLDEPTNDLDVETLEVLEDRLVNYSGTLIVVSHDREFLDNVVTSTLVFEEDGRIQEYVGGYSDWLRQGHQLAEKDRPSGRRAGAAQSGARKAKRSFKLSYKDERELAELPNRVAALEHEHATLQARVAAPDFYARDFAETQPVLDRLGEVAAEIDTTTARWLELEERREQLAREREAGA